jgi:hypothetical protein
LAIDQQATPLSVALNASPPAWSVAIVGVPRDNEIHGGDGSDRQ